MTLDPRKIKTPKLKSKPVRMDPRDRKEMIKKGTLQKVKPLPTKPQPRKMKKGGKA